MAKKKAPDSKNSSANIGFEAKLWLAADKLRNNMDAAEYKHVVLCKSATEAEIAFPLFAKRDQAIQANPSRQGYVG